jgi:uncharacterized alkaline shock family protein YloU
MICNDVIQYGIPSIISEIQKTLKHQLVNMYGVTFRNNFHIYEVHLLLKKK